VRTLTRSAALAFACCTALSLPAGAGPAAAAGLEPYLGRWDVTLHAPERDHASWLEIRQEAGRLQVRMVGRWGRAHVLPLAALQGGGIRFESPGEEEGLPAGKLVFEGGRHGEALGGAVSFPGGQTWTWDAQRAPALLRPRTLHAGRPIRLFNGRDLTGWTAASAARAWHVSNGTLVSPGGGADLATVSVHGDFSLHIEANCARGANSGVYLRGRYEVQIEDDVKPGAPDERTGAIYGFIAPAVAAPRAPGVWHAFDIRLAGRRVTVVEDGVTLIADQEIPGITGGAQDSHEGAPGPIALQGGEPGEVAFRNIVLTPLVADSAGADTPSPRVQRLLAAMSRAEKVAVIRGAHEPAAVSQGEAGWTAGVPRLRIPDLRFADGPQGVLVHHASTGMPSTLSLAATFSAEDARATGEVIGRDARALGIDVVLQPYINLYRDPTFERAYNTLGEDPVLTGTLAAGFVRGAQAQNVMVQAKHLAAYEGGADAQLDERTLREIYMAPFVDAARAGVASFMCAYNRINGIYACDSDRLINGILRAENGFSGFVTSDWGAAHGAEFILHGMDVEQPGTGPAANFALGPEPAEKAMTPEETAALVETLTSGVPEEQRFAAPKRSDAPKQTPGGVSKNLGEAFQRGTVSDRDLDGAAGHVLAQMERFGWLDTPPSHQVREEDVRGNARKVQRLAERGAVLLKNDGALPLSAADLASLALIGPGAQQTFAIVTGEEQSYGRAQRQIGAWQALASQGLGRGAQLAVADDMTGEPIPAQALAHLVSVQGGGEAQINLTKKAGRALPPGTDAQWDGTLMIPTDGDYDIDLQLLGATGRFSIDGRKIGNMGWWGGHGDIVFPNRDNVVPTTDGLDNVRRLVRLTAGPHAIHVEVAADGSGDAVQVRLAWVTPAMRASAFDAAVALAGRSRTAVVFAWSRNRPYFGLPGDQDRLIEAVAAVNPNTVVVLNTGQAISMPWLSKVRAVLEMWYTGDEGGWAAANLLTGRADPGGHLPISWPLHLTDYAATDPRFPERSWQGSGGRTIYSEGVNVGYRWLEHEGIAPLFPFGHGLSYTTFAYSDLTVTRTPDGVTVRCKVRNTGRRAGDAVVQAYLGAPDPAPAGVDFPARTLAAFERVRVQAGATREVRLMIRPERLRYWSATEDAWREAGAGRRLYVGTSSGDLPLSGPLQ
jgi:beta-glucosidase